MSKDKKHQQSRRKKLESGLDSAADSLFNSDRFAKGAGLATNVTARVQREVADRMGRNLGLMNMPSRDDITSLGERLIAMETRLLHIEEMLMRLVPDDASMRPASPPRTRKPAAKATAPAPEKSVAKTSKATKSKTKKTAKSTKSSKSRATGKRKADAKT